MNTFDSYPTSRPMMPIHESVYDPVARIVVIGIGGAGNNAINRMIKDGVKGVEFVGINTDVQDLKHCSASKRVAIGEKVTGGRGAGAIPEIGESAANESKEAIRAILRETETQKKADMVFITCGMGGGTGTGAAPIVANIAKEEGILTVAVVTKPFRFEGKVRMSRALNGISKLAPNVDTLISISNEKLLKNIDVKDGFKEAFAKADEVLKFSIEGITDLINLPALINLDFADVSTVMRGKGLAHISIGIGQGENRATEAIKKAMESPLLDTTIDGATDIIICIAGEVSLIDIDAAMREIEPKLSPDVNIIMGAREDSNLKDQVHVTLIATGIRDNSNVYGYSMGSSIGTSINSNYGSMPQPTQQMSQAIPTPTFPFSESRSEVNMSSNAESANSLFFTPKKKEMKMQDVEKNVENEINTSHSIDSLNVDLGKIGFTKDVKDSKVLPSFITEGFKK